MIPRRCRIARFACTLAALAPTAVHPAEPGPRSDPISAVRFAEQPAHALAFGRDGRLYVGRERQLWQIAPDGTSSLVTELPPAGNEKPWIWALAEHTGVLYGAAHDRIFRVAADGSVSNFVAEEFPGPCGVTDLVFDRHGDLYVAYDNCIARYGPDGRKEIVLDGTALKEPVIRWLTSLRIDQRGRFWLSDVRSRRVLLAELNPERRLEIKRVFQLPQHPEYLAVARDGQVFVGFPDGDGLARLDETGEPEYFPLAGQIDFPASMSFGPRGTDEDTLYLACRNGIFRLPSFASSDGPGSRTNALLERIEWLQGGHRYGSACIRIGGNPVIYVDPADLPDELTAPKADLVLLTHPHDDHFDPATLAKVLQPTTRIVTVRSIAKRLGSLAAQITILAPGESVALDSLTVAAVAAYNPAGGVHPQSAGWAGYVLTLDGVKVFFSGDTGLTPEMSALRDIDIAVVNGRAPYQMSGTEMVQAVAAMKPQFVIPIHWQETERSDIDTLRAGVSGRSQLVLLAPQ